MPSLFEQTTLSSLILKNRFVRSATWEGMADDEGACTPRLIDLMTRLADGGVGLIISGHAHVSREGQAGPGQMGIYDDGLLPGLARMASAVHARNGRIIVQLAHAGCQAATGLSGLPAMGPSVLEGEKAPVCREMTLDDIEGVVEAFAAGAARAWKAGFDGVQIHAAHGYLLSQFLSPCYNRRQDRYGGSIENRARIVLEVLDRIRRAVGKTFPVLIKLNSEDFVEGGFSRQDMLAVCQVLERAGMDAVELSGGTPLSGKNTPVRTGKFDTPDRQVFYRDAARDYKARIRIPLILVGGIRSLEVAEALAASSQADYIALCRPLIREPELIQRWQSGDTAIASCKSDNLCFKPAMEGRGIYCVLEEREKKGSE
ncbi:NADH:flavin oxidoreductase [Desulfococcus sp.]|uniref:NADH:flavin oxidoreductase n=1 Tax=Desulfococcus sp. TaxID=2025834 RepID=UPI00359442F1